MRFYILLTLLSFCSLSCASENGNHLQAQSRYKLYCMYTPKFKDLYDQYFLPSIKDDFEILVKEYPQDCSSGEFRTKGWDKTMLHKLELLGQAIEENWNDQIFLYSDIDIIFLKPVLEAVLNHLGNQDFVVQQGWPKNSLCAGFFVMRGNPKTLKLIKIARRLLEKKIYEDDQLAIQAALLRFKEGEISWSLLPSEQFPNGKRVLKNPSRQYTPEDEIVLDESIILFHGNCCVGLEAKYHFLNQVEAEFLNKNFLKNKD